jgi:hypothetical protein
MCHLSVPLQVNDQASDAVLAVEQEYNKKRLPIYEQRSVRSPCQRGRTRNVQPHDLA